MKFVLSLCIFLFSYSNSWAENNTDSTKLASDSTISNKQKIDDLTDKCLGVPYKWGGESMKGFDCSGFVRYVFKQLNIEVPHSSKAIANMGETIKLEDAQKGDLIIFTGYKDRENVGHLGIILENKKDALIFVHSSSAPKSMGVVKTNYYNSNYPKRFIKIIRLK